MFPHRGPGTSVSGPFLVLLDVWLVLVAVHLVLVGTRWYSLDNAPKAENTTSCVSADKRH